MYISSLARAHFSGGDSLKTILLSVLIGLPWVASGAQTIALGTQTINAERALENAFLRDLRRSPRPYLLVIEDSSKPMLASVRKLLQEDDIVDFSLVLRPFPRNRESANERSGAPNNIITINAVADAVQKRFNLGPDIRWAVVDSSERCLASGQDIPSAAELTRLLTAAGVKSPMRVLRDFLKTHPGHLEARIDLLRLQQQSAEQRTRAALGLEMGDTYNLATNLTTLPVGAGSFMIRTDMAGGNATIISDRPKQTEPIPKDKVLEAVLDLQIWGGYAESLDRLLTGDDWVAVGLSFNADDNPLEVCSPLVKGLYRRKISQVEAALERAPLNPRLWSVWIRMADVIGDRSTQAVVDKLTQRPGVGFSSWPREVRSKLIEEARANNRWNYLADSLWGEYENRLRTSPSGVSVSFNTSSFSTTNSNQSDLSRQIFDSMFSEEWNTLFEPLLEALICMNDLGRADSIMSALQERQKQGMWSETQMRKAIALANRCNKPDIARRWSIYVTESNT